MWSSVLVLGLLTGLDPVRLGITLLVISRPRPVQNLFAYGLGSLAACFPMLVVPLILLHVTPTVSSFAQTPATSVTSGRIQIGIGVLALSIAALLTLRSLTRRRERVQLPTSGGTASTTAAESIAPPGFSRLLGGTQDAGTEGGSAIRRLLGRVRNAWENGSLWVAFVIGFGFAGVPPLEALSVIAVVVASGVAIGTQLTAVVVFFVGLLAVVEIILFSYLATPAKTQAVLRLLHDWVLAHRQQLLVAIFAVLGVSLMARGIASI